MAGATLHRITFKLAAAAALVALCLGLAIGAVEASLDFSREKKTLDSLLMRILVVAKPTAARAVVVIDANLAQEVVGGLLEYDFVSSARIIDDLGEVMAAESRIQAGIEENWLVSFIDSGSHNYSIPLLDDPVTYAQQGSLAITVDPILLYSPFLDRVTREIGLTLLQALAFAFALMGVFHIFVTRPLRNLAGSFDRVSPREPGKSPLPMAKGHEEDELGMVARSGNQLLMAIQDLLYERKLAEKRIRAVTEAVSSVSGDNLLDRLVESLVEILGVDCAYIGVFADDRKSRIRTVTFVADGAKANDFEYGLAGSPCQNVVGKGICVFNGDVQQKFPEDMGLIKLGVESYIGVPLFDSEDEPLGLIVALNRKPLDNPETISDLLHIFGVRVAAELERSRAEAALKESEEQLRAVLDNSPALIFMKDRDGRYILTNRRFEEHYADKGGTIRRKTAHDHFPKEVADVIRRNDLEVLEKNAAVEFEEVIPHPDGDRTFISVKFPLRDASGEPYAVCCVATDITARKRAREALRQSEARFRTLVEYAPEAITIIDVDTGLYVEVNPMAEVLHGLPRDELVGKTGPADLSTELQPDGRPSSEATADYLSRALAGEFPRFEWMHRSPDGQETLCEVSLARLPDLHRNLVRASIFDITERKAAENALASQTRHLEIAEQMAHVGHWRLDVATRDLSFSDEMYRIRGWEVGSPVALDRVRDASQPDDWKFVEEGIRKAIEKKVGWKFEGQIFRPDGEMRIIHAASTVELGDDGEVVAIIGISQDITERERAEKELEKAERRYRNIVENATDGIFRSNEEGQLLWANRALARIGGFETAEELLSAVKNIADDIFVNPDDRKNLIEQLKKRGAVTNFIAQGRRLKTGEKFWFDSSVRAERGEDGMLYMEGVIRDITENRRNDERMRRVEKMQAIGQLTGGIAHDFNNLLGIVIGNLDMLELDIGDDPNLGRAVATALRAALRGANLTKQLLAFSRQAGEEEKPTCLNEVIKGLDTLMAGSLTAEVKVQTFLDDDLWFTMIDEGDFQDALLNLAINARDAMPTGGTLVIETKNTVLEPTDAGTIPGMPPDEYVMISVSDSGSGMTKEVVDRIFEPFFTTKQAGKGTGLGLSLVYSFVQRSKGHIRVYSEPDSGTTIRIFLPRARHIAQKSSSKQIIDQTVPRGEEVVLVVDDESDLVELAKRTLETLGYEVYTAGSGKEALKELSRHSDVDVLFTDVVMPGGMNGLELVDRALEQKPNLKVLLTSGFSDKIPRKGRNSRLLKLQLAKPYRLADMALRIRELLD